MLSSTPEKLFFILAVFYASSIMSHEFYSVPDSHFQEAPSLPPDPDLESSLENPYQIMTPYRPNLAPGQSHTLPIMGSKGSAYPQPSDSAEVDGDDELDQYVRMDTLVGVGLREMAGRVNKRVRNSKRENRTMSVISDISDDYVKREEFIGVKDVDEALRKMQEESASLK